jgi:hypothetical protein
MILSLSGDERYPTFLTNRLIEGIEMAFEFRIKFEVKQNDSQDKLQTAEFVEKILSDEFVLRSSLRKSSSINSDDTVGNDVIITSIFSSLYSTCVISNRKRQNDFLVSIIRSICSYVEIKTGDKSKMTLTRTQSNSKIDDFSLKGMEFYNYYKSIFLMITLAHLPYEYSSEPLLVIYWINRHVPLLITSILNFVQDHLLSLNNMCETVNDVIFLRSSTNNSVLKSPKSPRCTLEHTPSSRSNIDVIDDHHIEVDQTKLNDCYNLINSARNPAAIQNLVQYMKIIREYGPRMRCLEIFLRLKKYLKSRYSLTNEQCATFNPDEKAATPGRQAKSNSTSPYNGDRVRQLIFVERKTSKSNSNITEFFCPFDSSLVPVSVAYQRHLLTSNVSDLFNGMNDNDDDRCLKKKSACTADNNVSDVNLIYTVINDYNHLVTSFDEDNSSSNDFTVIAMTSKPKKRKSFNSKNKTDDD